MSIHYPVSVCLLTYNRAPLLVPTIESLLGQTFGEFEFIISDDNSTDETPSICQEYARRDKRVKYIRRDSNLGMPANMNAALETAAGEYVANLHDGDVYRPDLIAKWKQALDEYPTTGFVFNAYRTVWPDGREAINRENLQRFMNGADLGVRLLSRWGSCVFGTVMARRSIYAQLGWFDPQFGNFSDVDMWLRIAREHDVAYIDEPLMDLMPKDPSRFYAFVHWRVLFWLLGIHTLNLARYRSVIPTIVDQLTRCYPQRRRRLLSYNMLLCIKHRRFDRVREGFAIWRDADDIMLRTSGRLFGRALDVPEWYDARQYWSLARLKM